MPWDPGRYLVYADERGRPFVDLLARVGADDPATVVDLGCGAGNLTAQLAQRWPSADVLGIDSSPEMIAAAPDTCRFEVGSIEVWDGNAEVVISNAALQWVPGHLALLPGLADRACSWFAFQVPGNFAAPSHVILRELAAEEPFAPYTTGAQHPDSFGADVYLDVLQRPGWEVDAWETTYLHVLQGEDPVFTWISSTGARPTLAALPDGLREAFVAELKLRLARAYPAQEYGVVLPFRRVFVVARRNAR